LHFFLFFAAVIVAAVAAVAAAAFRGSISPCFLVAFSYCQQLISSTSSFNSSLTISTVRRQQKTQTKNVFIKGRKSNQCNTVSHYF